MSEGYEVPLSYRGDRLFKYRLDMHNIFMYIFKKKGLIYYLVVPICLEDVLCTTLFSKCSSFEIIMFFA